MEDELIKLLLYYELKKDTDSNKQQINETFDKIIAEVWEEDDNT